MAGFKPVSAMFAVRLNVLANKSGCDISSVVDGDTPTANIEQNTFESTSTLPETTTEVLATDANAIVNNRGGGPLVGALVGMVVGWPDGCRVGKDEGLVMVGETVGNAVRLAFVGLAEGPAVGALVGAAVTITVGM